MTDDSFILKYFFTDGTNLNRTQRILFMLFFLIMGSILFLYGYSLNSDSGFLELLFAYIFIVIFVFYPFINVDKFDKKYGLHSDLRFGNTFQYHSKLLSIFSMGFIPAIIVCCNILNKLSLGILIDCAFCIPIGVAFFRTDVFNDKNCYVGDKIVLGYNPNLYFFPSLLFGFFGYYNSFLLFSSNLGNSIFLAIIAFIIQILFAFPDYINKCVPFEIRTIKGFLYFFIPLIICYISMAYLLAGEKIFNTLNITLTPAQIIRNIIIISSGLTMGFLFYRQAKQMNKKE